MEENNEEQSRNKIEKRKRIEKNQRNSEDFSFKKSTRLKNI
jgi:hypothetical protein